MFACQAFTCVTELAVSAAVNEVPTPLQTEIVGNAKLVFVAFATPASPAIIVEPKASTIRRTLLCFIRNLSAATLRCEFNIFGETWYVDNNSKCVTIQNMTFSKRTLRPSCLASISWMLGSERQNGALADNEYE